MKPVAASFYDKAYFTDGTKSNYKPYGPGVWAQWLGDMVGVHLNPASLLDVGCAYGYLVEFFTRHGVRAHGFDISEYAISRAHPSIRDRVWVGDATAPSSYERATPIDLVTATELGEHLTPNQAADMLANMRAYAQRALLLVAMYPDGEEPAGHVGADAEKDLSHINIKPVSWWLELAQRCGWEIDDASRFNEDPRAREMQWAGRFLLLRRPR